ncbi:unnamed protein product [Colias eurytheme]|nr:unnamed protein product [Colias eurytheme]
MQCRVSAIRAHLGPDRLATRRPQRDTDETITQSELLHSGCRNCGRHSDTTILFIQLSLPPSCLRKQRSFATFD